MKVLVTGAAGRIGRNLAAALVAGGASVRGAALPGDPGVERLKAAGIEPVEGNLRDPAFCRAIVAGVDAVAHLGAMLLFRKGEDDPDLLADNVVGTCNLLHAVAMDAPNISRFVFASSDEVYPSLYAKYSPIDEDHPKQPYSFYGVTKLTGEEYLRYYGRAHGIPYAIARFALTIEPWEALRPDRPLGNFFHLESMIPFIRGRAGEAAAAELEAKFESGARQLWVPRDEGGASWLFHFCDVRDLVSGLQLLLTKPEAAGEAFNLSGPAPFSFAEAVPYLASKTGQPVVDTVVAGEAIRIHHSIAKARGLLGYRPRHDVFATIDEALATAQG